MCLRPWPSQSLLSHSSAGRSAQGNPRQLPGPRGCTARYYYGLFWVYKWHSSGNGGMKRESGGSWAFLVMSINRSHCDGLFMSFNTEQTWPVLHTNKGLQLFTSAERARKSTLVIMKGFLIIHFSFHFKKWDETKIMVLLLSKAAFFDQKYSRNCEILLVFKAAVFYVNMC